MELSTAKSNADYLKISVTAICLVNQPRCNENMSKDWKACKLNTLEIPRYRGR